MILYIKPVTEENRTQVLHLHVAPNQKTFIETTAQCLAEADKESRWHPVAIYDEDTLVGFAMYGAFISPTKGECVWLDRFLIGEGFQHHGYGEQALVQLIDLLQEEYRCQRIYLSLYDDNTVAKALYQKHGFAFNGELDRNGERVMVKDL